MGDIVASPPGRLIVLEPERADRHPAAVYLAGLGQSSRRPMRHALNVMAHTINERSDAWTVNWPALRFQHTAAIRSALMGRYAPATVNRMLSALRGVLRACWQLGLMTAEEYHRAAHVKNVKGERLPAGRAVTTGELAALIKACVEDRGAAGPRDAAMIGLMFCGGPRRAEITALDLTDYDAETGAVRIRSGKGHKDRLTYVEAGTMDAITDWLGARGLEDGSLFCPVLRSGRVVVRRLSDNAVYRMLAKRAEQAGVESLTPHDLRRTFVGELLDAGVDLATVQKLAGHSDPATTARYDRRDEATKMEAVRRLHVPYRRRRR